jgi:kynurenine 3-monooxygenase
MSERIVVIGAGLSGSIISSYLAKLGYDISIYERLSDSRVKEEAEARSINLTLSTRGLNSLSDLGILEEALSKAVTLRGRSIHQTNGKVNFQPYGNRKEEVLYSIQRYELQKILLDHLGTLPNVEVSFESDCIQLDKNKKKLVVQSRQTDTTKSVQADLIVGADGTFSTIRQQIQKRERVDYRQDFLDWGYKQFIIPANPDGSYQLKFDSLHVWPRGERLLVAIPNPDGTFTCTCVLPFEGTGGYSSLHTEEEVRRYFQNTFPDLLVLVPDLIEQFFRNPTGNFLTLRTSQWYYKSNVVLIGDACHGIAPFLGQGLNAACEDSAILCSLVATHGITEAAFAQYQMLRKPNTDVLADLTLQNFYELRAGVGSHYVTIRKQLDLVLNRLFPNHWVPLYTMIAHTTEPYARALKRSKKQDRALSIGLVSILLFLVFLASALKWILTSGG